MKLYDFLIVGAGLFGSIFAYEANKRGYKCLVIEKREHIGGNLYCENIEDINVHRYGAHIFHTSNKVVWQYINQFAEFNNYVNSPIAIYKGELYNLPFNMNTFRQLWGVITPEEAKREIEKQRACWGGGEPRNLEEQAISLVGRDVFKILIKGYTEKQWGRSCTELPATIIKRIPVRFRYDNNYYDSCYQGIPIGGYNRIFDALLKGIDIKLGVDYITERNHFKSVAKKTLYTGMLDEFYAYQYGALEYRSLRFENEVLDVDNFQGNAVVNYTDLGIPYTRIIEHKHFEFGRQAKTVITREYPEKWSLGKAAYYPIGDGVNNDLYERYCKLAAAERDTIFGGRLADYKYYDMHHVVQKALDMANNVL